MSEILFVTNRENFKIFIDNETVGFKARRRTDQTKPGDLLVCYISGIGKIAGIIKIESTMFEERTKIFTEKTPGEIYPWRLKCGKYLILPEDKWIPVAFFHDKLELFRQKAPYYSLALQGQIHFLNPEDFKTIEEKLAEAS